MTEEISFVTIFLKVCFFFFSGISGVPKFCGMVHICKFQLTQQVKKKKTKDLRIELLFNSVFSVCEFPVNY